METLKRGPAVVLPKDAGFIIAYAKINKNSIVLDAGTGSGFLAIYLSNTAKKVITYEKRKEFYDIAKDNIKKLKIKNIIIKNKDIYKKIEEKNLDLITLDLAEPWKVFSYAIKSLKENALLVCYIPTIEQLKIIMEKIKKPLKLELITELIQRDWQSNPLRPKSQMIAHTGYLVFIRKV